MLLEEILRIVREVDAPRPSQKLSTLDALPSVAANRDTEPAKLTKMFRGELDWVLLKSLEKDRCRRYQSANAFAADIRNYLTDEVVEARPPSRGYRLRKFVSRHRGPVIAAAAVFVALVAGIAGTAWGLVEARWQKREAVQAQGKEATQRGLAEVSAKDANAARIQAETAKRTADDARRERNCGGPNSARRGRRRGAVSPGTGSAAWS